MFMKNRGYLLLLGIVLGLICSMGTASAVERVRMVTNLGNIDVILFDEVTPITVANFLAYVRAGRYASSLIHRSIPGFVIQGGGFVLEGNQIVMVEKYAPIVNEYHLSNVRGTIAMAKLPDNPDSATNEWFFNLKDNSSNLDFQNGGFTVFGKVTTQSLAVMDAIAAVTTYNASGKLGPAFANLPLLAPQLSGNNLVIVGDIIPEARLDQNSPVDLIDAVCALRIIVGIEGQEAPLVWDVNGDGRIGIEEVIYILQNVANLR
jgi:cyclophilin family peptidyl-prolyl cis-trans isomerase